MFCPNCGKQNVIPSDESPNGGVLFVAEELSSCIEYYDQAIGFECPDCNTYFYMGTVRK